MKTCDRCFAELNENAAYCHDCGAPVKTDNPDNLHLEGSDREVYPQLAAANLLRMRGQWKEAEDECISILRRFPNNPTAHALLGDICVDQERIDEAVQWFQLALDLNPNGIAEKQKLAQLERRKQELEAAAAKMTAPVQVGKRMASSKSSNRLWIYALVGLISCILLMVVFLAGYLYSKKYVSPAPPAPEVPIAAAPPIEKPVDNSALPPQNNVEQPPPPPPVIANARTNIEQDMLHKIAQSAPDAAKRMLDIQYDPRLDGRLNIAVTMPPGANDMNRLYADVYKIASTVFETTIGYRTLSIRVLINEQNSYSIYFIGDCERDVILNAPRDFDSAMQIKPLFMNIFERSN